MIGKTLAHYTVLEKLGEGGMGVVYKARDTHLDRFVALKLLPPDKLADTERKRRFIQEAKSASALNHPNIVTIYDIAESDGVLFIAMEYVTGKSLDQLIGRGLRSSDALKYAVQVADALSKAHQAGIVHRDLKPQNIMVSDDGLVKVLDFGLAKLTEAEPESDETLTAADKPKTADGQILGTVAFMSPEQAEGRKIDARSDIFSFGAVLYEMVTGRRAFQGPSRVATLASVLREEPKPAREITESLPSDFDRIISRCLRKDPERRFQTMADLRVSLQELKDESDSGRLTHAPAAHRAESKRSLWLAVALGVVVVAAVSIVWYVQRAKPKPAAVADALPLKAIPLTTLPGSEISPSFSPDGNQVAFTWDGEGAVPHIYVKVVGPGRALRLTDDKMADYSPSWSPDGRYIAFYRSRDAAFRPGQVALMLIPALGGTERKLVDLDVQPYSGAQPSWSPDSKWLAISARFGAPNNSVARYSLDTGELTKLSEPPLVATHGDDCPAISRDGRWLAFVRSSVNGNGTTHILPWTTQGTAIVTPRQLDTSPFTAFRIAWMPDSRELVLDNGAMRPLMARIMADSSAKATAVNLRDASYPTLAATGNRLAYVEPHFDINIWEADLAWTGGIPRATGKWRMLTPPNTRKVNAQYSPDGKRIAFSSNRAGNLEIWVADADGSNAQQLTTEGANTTGSPHWSPDGSRLAFDVNLHNRYDIGVINADGGKPSFITHEFTSIVPVWSADGSRLYFGSNRTGQFEIWTMTSSGADARQLTKNGGLGAALSRDGKTLFFSRGQGTTAQLWKMPVDGGPEEMLSDDLYRYSFVPWEKGIFYLSAKAPISVMYIDFATGKKSQVLLGEQRPELGLSVSPDGKRIMFSKVDHIEADLMLVETFR